jgi:flagellar basal-body rod modification protein FlgD
MSIASITANSSTASSSSSSSSSVSTAYDTFLKLLTTQLENQDPLNATDPNQFTSELISLAGVEQQEDSNTSLSSIVSSLSSLTAATGVGYIGKEVETSTSTAPVQSGSAEWTYDLSGTAATVSLVVTDSTGATVWTGAGDTSSGSHTLTWDGIENNGTTVTSGGFTLSVDATDSSGDAVTTTVGAKGTVTGVDSSSGTTEIDMGGVTVALDDITSVAA